MVDIQLHVIKYCEAILLPSQSLKCNPWPYHGDGIGVHDAQCSTKKVLLVRWAVMRLWPCCDVKLAAAEHPYSMKGLIPCIITILNRFMESRPVALMQRSVHQQHGPCQHKAPLDRSPPQFKIDGSEGSGLCSSAHML